MKRHVFLILGLMLFSAFFLSASVMTATADTPVQKIFESSLKETGQATGYTGSPENAATSLPQRIGKAVNMVLSLIGVFFLGLMIYGGYTWMLARGNEQEVEKAKSIIKNAIIGLFIVLAAYGVTAFISNALADKAI